MSCFTRSLLVSLAAASSNGCAVAGDPEPPPAGAAARSADKLVQRASGIASEYIVVLRDSAIARRAADPRRDVDAAIDRVAASHPVAIKHRYTAALRGFAARMIEADARAIAADPAVELVEQNAVVHATEIQRDATWGLDRIDQRSLPLDREYAHAGDGAGATVFVIDTGINTSHVEFTGRLLEGGTAVEDGNGVEDCNGHGTHVAATVAGTVFGVAKRAAVVPIRVLGCDGSGSFDGVIAGIDFVTQHHPAGSVANLSLGGPASASVDTAIRNAVASGVTMVVAAGNEAQDACDASPAREPVAITVGATTVVDTRSEFSNFGRCVDLSAPGSDITSAWIGSPTTINTISGTSMASPHVAGAAALFVGLHPTATPAEVAAALVASATPGKLTDLSGSPNLLLHTRFAAAPAAPEVAIASPADGAQVPASFAVTVDVRGEGLVEAALVIDGTAVETRTEGAIAFQVANLPAGPHSLEVIVSNAADQSGRDSVTVTVGGFGGGGNVDPPPPPPPLTGTDDGGCSTGGSGAGLGMVALLAVCGVRRRRASGCPASRA